MKFILDDEQRLFGSTVDKLLSAADVPSVARAWASGSHGAGVSLWRSLADAGLFALAVPEAFGGAGPLPVELVTAFRLLGSHGVPGPYVETVAASALLGSSGHGSSGHGSSSRGLSGHGFSELASEWLPRIAEGEALASLTLADVPYALDADTADLLLAVSGNEARRGVSGPMHESIDPARRLFTLAPGDVVASVSSGDAGAAYDMGTLMAAAQIAGIGERLLAVTVEYAKTRQQFGKPIGEFQAVKHHLANAYVVLEHARPLLYGAALAYGTPSFPREVSAAKAATSEATYFTSRIALQVHGAIGYTDEYDPSLLIRKARALRGAWASPSAHKARVLAFLT
ncbi:MAG TPA: acyl-CoA dehydrogenase family protein [Trebonia sp.]